MLNQIKSDPLNWLPVNVSGVLLAGRYQYSYKYVANVQILMALVTVDRRPSFCLTFHHFTCPFRVGVQYFPWRNELRSTESRAGYRTTAHPSSRRGRRRRSHSGTFKNNKSKWLPRKTAQILHTEYCNPQSKDIKYRNPNQESKHRNNIFHKCHFKPLKS